MLPVDGGINSVPQTIASPVSTEIPEVGSPLTPQPMIRKSLEVKDKSTVSPLNQFHSKHGSEHITTAVDQTNSSLVNDRKHQLQQITGKCANKIASPPIQTNQSPDLTKSTPVLQKYYEKQLSVPNWFPSKRNSLILLADQHLDSEIKKKYQRCSEPGANKMVAMQELATAATFDESEELQYGPGIVSKLRCRYLSLALRQNVKQRPTLDNLRRANSMSNLLEEENVDIDEVDDRNGHNHNNVNSNNEHNSCQSNENNKIHLNGSHDASSIIQVEYSPSSYNYCTNDQKNNVNETNGDVSKTNNKLNDSRCRQVLRGNDSLKRARSVEALMRYDTLAWRRDVLEDSEDYPSSNPIILDEIIVSDYQSTVIKAQTPDSITIEDKIQQARDRMMDPKPPRRLTSFMSDTERPPPDLVKQTLLKFEASANRRSRGGIQRYGNGDVAAKVATYKSKLSHDKISPPQQITSKLPPSGFVAKKPVIKPRTSTSPKPVPFLNGTKDTSPTKKSPGIYTKSIEHDTIDNHSFNGNGLKASDVERMNQKNAAAAGSMRNDSQLYRTKYDSASSPDSPMTSPTSETPRSSYVYDLVRRRENNHADSPLITQLARKTESLVLDTPKSRKISSDVAFSTDDSSVQPSDNDEIDDATSNSSETGWSESYDVNISDNDMSETDEPAFLAPTKKPPVPKHSKLNGNQIKATVISVSPSNCISNGGSVEKKSESQPEPSVRQIGIIRPLNHDTKPPVPVARKNQSSKSNGTAKKDSSDSIKVSVAAAPFVVSTQHSVVLPSSASSVVVTNSVSVATSNDVQGDVVVIECSGDSNIDSKSVASSSPPTMPNNRTKLLNNTEPNTISIDTRSIVHQKNLLNKEKSEEVLNGSGQGLMIQSPIKWNIKKSTVVSSSPVSNASSTVVVNQTPSPQTQQTATKQRPSDIQTTNTMVFNFSNRKDVPDYIENDGLVIRRKRELPKVRHDFFLLFFNQFKLLNFYLYSQCFIVGCVVVIPCQDG